MNVSDTGDTKPLPPLKPKKRVKKRSILNRKSIFEVLFVASLTILLIFAISSGMFYGYQQAETDLKIVEATGLVQTLQDQYDLAMVDFSNGQYELARQRLEYIFQVEPEFPGVVEKWIEIMRILNVTATPTPIPPTATSTPTPDLRPNEELFQLAQGLIMDGKWNEGIERLLALRHNDLLYRVVEVDDLLFIALRNRGIQKIHPEGNLEGGIYDLALAQRFGPLDTEAEGYRSLASLYMSGMSFWEVFPEMAVYYFSQVASISPYLQDSSGWTALYRYRAALIQYGDQLAKEENWCSARDQYDAAFGIQLDETAIPTATYVAYQCSPPTLTPTAMTATETATLTTTPTGTISISPTGEITYTATPTPALTLTPTPSWTVKPAVTPTPSGTNTPTITSTPEPAKTP